MCSSHHPQHPKPELAKKNTIVVTAHINTLNPGTPTSGRRRPLQTRQVAGGEAASTGMSV